MSFSSWKINNLLPALFGPFYFLQLIYLVIYLTFYLYVFHYHTVLHVHESFPFCSIPLPAALPPLLAAILLPIYKSVSIVLVHSVFSLDFTYEWNHMVFVFLWLAYFTCIMFSRSIHAIAKVKIFYCLWPSSIPLCKCTIAVLPTHLSVLNTIVRIISLKLFKTD